VARVKAVEGSGVLSRQARSRPVPVLTTVALTGTLLGTVTRAFGPGVFDALRRDPGRPGHGQLWRLLSPVLVQGDHSLLAIIAVFVLCAAIGVAGEWLLPRAEWLLLYVLGALAGHGLGEAFQPHQSGMSVAFAGILGGIAARILLDPNPRLKGVRVRFAVLIPLAVLDTALRDIHGAPFLVGLAAGAWFELRRRTRGKQTLAGERTRVGSPADPR